MVSRVFSIISRPELSSWVVFEPTPAIHGKTQLKFMNLKEVDNCSDQLHRFINSDILPWKKNTLQHLRKVIGKLNRIPRLELVDYSS